MAKAIHNGTELNNITETWEQNEQNRNNNNAGGNTEQVSTEQPSNNLESIVKEEASEYDNANKEGRILGGDRATVNDEESNNESNE